MGNNHYKQTSSISSHNRSDIRRKRRNICS